LGPPASLSKQSKGQAKAHTHWQADGRKSLHQSRVNQTPKHRAEIAYGAAVHRLDMSRRYDNLFKSADHHGTLGLLLGPLDDAVETSIIY
jgi:hypothetical protein